jgi:hypothetical protein
MRGSQSDSQLSTSFDLNRSLQLLKFGHSSSLDCHVDYVPNKLQPRSCLLGKLPSIPKLPVDNSVEMAAESLTRRTMQNTIINSEPTAFRRY